MMLSASTRLQAEVLSTSFKVDNYQHSFFSLPAALTFPHRNLIVLYRIVVVLSISIAMVTPLLFFCL